MSYVFSFLIFLSSIGLASSQASADEAHDLIIIEQLLKSGKGVEGSMHAVSTEQDLFVFAYTGENGFFEQVRLSLAPKSKEAYEILKTLNRHDRVRVFGKLSINNKQPHIELSEVQLLKAWGSPFTPYSHELKLPADLLGKDSFVGKVHAVHGAGAVVVLEYKDSVLPLVVKSSEITWTKDLFRGDKIKVYFDIADHPSQPTHLKLNKKTAPPVEVLDVVRAEHGKIYDFEGSLVMFPQSPQIKFNVFALQRDMGDGVFRDYTIIPYNFDEKIFKKLRDDLQALWDKSPEPAVNNRNKWIKKSVRIRVKGMINVIDPNQANPQIFFQDLKDVTF